MTIMTPSQVNYFPPEGCYEFTEYFTPEFDISKSQGLLEEFITEENGKNYPNWNQPIC